MLPFVVHLNILLLFFGLAAAVPGSYGHHYHGHGQRCTPEKESVRKEWGSLTKHERNQYIDAVLCLQQKPSIMPSGLVPGAKTRFDDFTAIHVNQTLGIHLDGIFLSWHRNFVWLWETALREECGYKGYQPYWNWALWCSDLAGSPLFDGSDTSLSGDGIYNNTGPYVVAGNATLPHGTGGGCAKDGPFKVTLIAKRHGARLSKLCAKNDANMPTRT